MAGGQKILPRLGWVRLPLKTQPEGEIERRGACAGYRPRHQCFTDGRDGLPAPMDDGARVACEGASTWLDDDEVPRAR